MIQGVSQYRVGNLQISLISAVNLILNPLENLGKKSMQTDKSDRAT